MHQIVWERFSIARELPLGTARGRHMPALGPPQSRVLSTVVAFRAGV